MPHIPTSIELIKIAALIPYANNTRTHSKEQIAQIVASIREFGFTNPVLIDENDGIIAGHGRVIGAGEIGMPEVPCIRLAHLSDAQRRAYVIADNKIPLSAGWDFDALKVELDALRSESFDLALTGFNTEEIDSMLDPSGDGGGGGDGYTRKVKAPTYEPKGVKPEVSKLYDEAKTNAMLGKINAAKVPDEVRAFLFAAAHRHTVFNFENIAEFYAQSEPEIQELFEDSALVIIDFEKAIEKGFVVFSDNVREMFAHDNPEDSGTDEA